MKCTSSIGLIKRAVPFLATFALALFVTSFFVDIRPGFRHRRGERKFQEMQQMRMELEQLRFENEQLKNGAMNHHPGDGDAPYLEFDAPVPPPPPAMPVAPHAHK